MRELRGSIFARSVRRVEWLSEASYRQGFQSGLVLEVVAVSCNLLKIGGDLGGGGDCLSDFSVTLGLFSDGLRWFSSA